MKKKIIIILVTILCLITSLVLATKWSEYPDWTSGEIVDVDTFLIRDVSDTTLAPTGSQKEYPWSAMKTDIGTATITLTNKTIDADDNIIQDMPYDVAWGLGDPVDADIYYIRLQRAMTLSSIGCIVDPEGTGESVVLDIQECDSNGDNCASSLSSTITCANTPTAGTISDGVFDASDFIKVDIGTVTGTVKTLSIYGLGKETY